MPMGPYEDFAACMLDQMEHKGRSEELARKVCGAMMRDTEHRDAHKVVETTEVQVETVEIESAVWSTAYVNNLPDSAFLYIAPGGKKDGEGKTTPRSLRYFPVRDANGKLDAAHVRNAIARIPQSNAPGLTDGKKRALQERARKLLASVKKVEDDSAAAVRSAIAKALIQPAPEAPAPAGEERYVLGIVLEPETVDAQNDIYSADAIRKTAHEFMESYQQMGLMHAQKLDGEIRILESFIAPVDFQLGGQTVRKGTWLLGARIVSDTLWANVKDGTFNGWSMGGDAIRVPEGGNTPDGVESA